MFASMKCFYNYYDKYPKFLTILPREIWLQIEVERRKQFRRRLKYTNLAFRLVLNHFFGPLVDFDLWTTLLYEAYVYNGKCVSELNNEMQQDS